MAVSRFSRTNSAPTTPDPSNDVSVDMGEIGDLTARHQALQELGRDVADRRLRYEIKLEALMATDKALSQQAAALGIETPEALLSLIEKQEMADKTALDQYEKALNEEKALLDKVDQALTEQGAEE